MEKIKEQVNKLATDEQARSMEKFPLFSSLHEGYAVLLEEVEEGRDEIDKANAELYALWDSIKKNETGKAIEHLKNLEEYTTLAISEYIQALAMIKKALRSVKYKEADKKMIDKRMIDRYDNEYYVACDICGEESDQGFETWDEAVDVTIKYDTVAERDEDFQNLQRELDCIDERIRTDKENQTIADLRKEVERHKAEVDRLKHGQEKLIKEYEEYRKEQDEKEGKIGSIPRDFGALDENVRIHARKVKEYCVTNPHGCEGCVFNPDDCGCTIGNEVPENWVIGR